MSDGTSMSASKVIGTITLVCTMIVAVPRACAVFMQFCRFVTVFNAAAPTMLRIAQDFSPERGPSLLERVKRIEKAVGLKSIEEEILAKQGPPGPLE
jgi:hypothetical protein